MKNKQWKQQELLKIELIFGEEEKAIIDNRLQQIYKNISNNPKVTITYFIPDKKKTGGEYVTIIENVNKIDKYKSCLIMCNNIEIPFNEIIEIII